jgi:hypothetical protein
VLVRAIKPIFTLRLSMTPRKAAAAAAMSQGLRLSFLSPLRNSETTCAAAAAITKMNPMVAIMLFLP